MLPFTAEALFAQFAQYNRLFWPAPPIGIALCLLVLWLLLRPTAWSGRLIAGLLALAWLWTGIAYHLLTFAKLNFAAPAYAAGFVLQGLLLAWTGTVRGRTTFRFQPDAAGWTGLAFAIAAVILYPAADRCLGFGWDSVRLPGLAPAPTVLLTLGVLLLSAGPIPRHLAMLPLLWAAGAGATGWILGIPQDVALTAAGLAALGLMVDRSRRKPQ